MRVEDKGKQLFCGGNPVGQGLPERAGFIKKKAIGRVEISC